MRQLAISISLLTVFLAFSETALAEREGVPGRRVGGGTRWTASRYKRTVSMQAKLSAMAFASRAQLPKSLKVKALYS